MARETNFAHPPNGIIALVGYDSVNNRWQAVHVDASGNLQIDVAAPDQLEALSHGYISSAWQKLPMLWGYSGTVSDVISDTNLSGGTNNLYSDVVPAGEVWVVSAITGYVLSGTCTAMYIAGVIGGENILFRVEQPPTSGAYYLVTGQFVFGEGDKLWVQLAGCTAGDDGQLRFCGYKMDIDL